MDGGSEGGEGENWWIERDVKLKAGAVDGFHKNSRC